MSKTIGKGETFSVFSLKWLASEHGLTVAASSSLLAAASTEAQEKRTSTSSDSLNYQQAIQRGTQAAIWEF
jgi:hypothetical protein